MSRDRYISMLSTSQHPQFLFDSSSKSLINLKLTVTLFFPTSSSFFAGRWVATVSKQISSPLIPWSQPLCSSSFLIKTYLGGIFPIPKGDFPFPQVGYVNSSQPNDYKMKTNHIINMMSTYYRSGAYKMIQGKSFHRGTTYSFHRGILKRFWWEVLLGWSGLSDHTGIKKRFVTFPSRIVPMRKVLNNPTKYY